MNPSLSASASKSIRLSRSSSQLGSGLRSNGILPPNVTGRDRQSFSGNGFRLPRSTSPVRSRSPSHYNIRESLDAQATDNRESFDAQATSYRESLDAQNLRQSLQHNGQTIDLTHLPASYNPITESKAPSLANATLKAWETFCPLLATYRHLSGNKTLGQLMTRTAASAYTDLFHGKDLSPLSDDALIDLINVHHYGQKTSQPHFDLADIAMKEIQTYDKHLIQLYLSNFSELKSSDRANLSQLDERALAVTFLKGIGYVPFRKLCENSRPKTYYDALDTVHKVTAMFDTALIVFNCIETCNGSSKDSKLKSSKLTATPSTKSSSYSPSMAIKEV